MIRFGRNCIPIYTCMTVNLVISLPKILYIHRIYIWLWLTLAIMFDGPWEVKVNIDCLFEAAHTLTHMSRARGGGALGI